MSSTTAQERRDDTNLSGSRALDGVSENTTSIPAVGPGAKERSDSGNEIVNASPPAPQARTSRRGFIMNTMVLAPSLATATAVPRIATAEAAALATPHPDPIFAAIAEHKSAVEAYGKAIRNNFELEDTLPADRCRSNINAWERKIVETDDPRWIEAEEQVKQTSDAMDDAAVKILDLEPQTLEGAVAVLRYAVDHIDRYDEMMGWPDDLPPDGVDPDTAQWNAGRSPEYFLMRNVAASLERLSKVSLRA